MKASDFPYFDAPFLAFAHRGGTKLAANHGRENTLHAFEQAISLGYRYLETDVHVTRDDVVVAFHDDHLDRVTDRTGKVADLRWRELRQARIGGIDPIPTLAEVLTTFRDTRINIDIKSPGAVRPLIKVLGACSAWDRVCVSSFDNRSLARFRRLAGRPVATGMGPREVAWTRFVPLLPRLFSARGVAIQIPPYTSVGSKRVRLVTAGLISAAHASGRQVHVWTIDDAREMHTLIDLGVDGIVSDQIDVLRDVLIERGLWHGVE